MFGGDLGPAREVGLPVGGQLDLDALERRDALEGPQQLVVLAQDRGRAGLHLLGIAAHAATSFAGALAYSRLGLPAAGLYGLAVGMACSRVYLGVHYPSDVLAGALLGTAAAAAATRPPEAGAGPG